MSRPSVGSSSRSARLLIRPSIHPQVTQIEIPDLDAEIYNGGQTDAPPSPVYRPYNGQVEEPPPEEDWLHDSGDFKETIDYRSESLWEHARKDSMSPRRQSGADTANPDHVYDPYSGDGHEADRSATPTDVSTPSSSRKAAKSPALPRGLRNREATGASTKQHPNALTRKHPTTVSKRVDRRQISKTNFSIVVRKKEKAWEEMGHLPLEPYSQKALDRANRMTTREQFELDDDVELVKPRALKELPPEKKDYYARMAEPRKVKTVNETFSFKPEMPPPPKNPVWKSTKKKKGKTFDPTEYARKRKEAIDAANVAHWQPSQWTAIPEKCYKPTSDAHHNGTWD